MNAIKDVNPALAYMEGMLWTAYEITCHRVGGGLMCDGWWKKKEISYRFLGINDFTAGLGLEFCVLL